MGEWMDTPQTVMTTRAPAVLANHCMENNPSNYELEDNNQTENYNETENNNGPNSPNGNVYYQL